VNRRMSTCSFAFLALLFPTRTPSVGPGERAALGLSSAAFRESIGAFLDGRASFVRGPRWIHSHGGAPSGYGGSGCGSWDY